MFQHPVHLVKTISLKYLKLKNEFYPSKDELAKQRPHFLFVL